ncbi:MAG TPA: hypothetical protein PKC24_09265 [Cyclobacteriaceae bacterium]|nr:hypothetical protein [Cyclobacteriaceae bacterium]
MIFRKIILSILISIIAVFALAQSQQENLRFALYLMDKKNYDEAIYVLTQLSRAKTNTSFSDSVNFLLGKTYYNLQELDLSSKYFNKLSGTRSRLKSEAVFFSSFNQAYLRNTTQSIQQLKFYDPEENLQALKIFELSGFYLLSRNFNAFDSLSILQNVTGYQFNEQLNNFSNYRKRLEQTKNKSMFAGGMMSAIIPGSGKIYAGRPGQGIYNFFITGILGLQTLEAYNKSGPESFRFIAYATLFSSFYIGNIWGSALAVKVKRDETLQGIDQQILFDLHIPLRTIFH